jgi:hypothetical protein
MNFAPTAQEEAEKINAQTGIGLVVDQSFWEKQGVSTGEELAKTILAQTYSDFFKELNGRRPRGRITPDMTVAQIEALIDDLDQQAKDEWYEERHMTDQEMWHDELIASVEATPKSIPDEYLEYEKVPQQQGMGRRGSGSKSQRRMESVMKISKRQLRKIIKEEKVKLQEIGGADHDGSLMDLDDYYELEDLLTVQLRDFLRGGYSKPDLIQALTNIVNDAL